MSHATIIRTHKFLENYTTVMTAELEESEVPPTIKDKTSLILKYLLNGLVSSDFNFSMVFLEGRKLAEILMDHIMPSESNLKLAQKIESIAQGEFSKVVKSRQLEFAGSIDFLRRNGNEVAHKGMPAAELSVVWDMLCHLTILLSCLKVPNAKEMNKDCTEPHSNISIAKIFYGESSVSEATICWHTEKRQKIAMFQLSLDDVVIQRKFATKLTVSCDSKTSHKIKLHYKCQCGWRSPWSNEYLLGKDISAVLVGEVAKTTKNKPDEMISNSRKSSAGATETSKGVKEQSKDSKEILRCDGKHSPIIIQTIRSRKRKDQYPVVWKTNHNLKLITFLQLQVNNVALEKRKFGKPISCGFDNSIENQVQIRYQCSCKEWSDWSVEYLLKTIEQRETENNEDSSLDNETLSEYDETNDHEEKVQKQSLSVPEPHVEQKFPQKSVSIPQQEPNLSESVMLKPLSVPESQEEQKLKEKSVSIPHLEMNVSEPGKVKAVSIPESLEEQKFQEKSVFVSHPDRNIIQPVTVKAVSVRESQQEQNAQEKSVERNEIESMKLKLMRNPPAKDYCYMIAGKDNYLTCMNGKISLAPKEPNNPFQLWKFDNSFIVCKANNLVLDIMNYSFFGSALKPSLDLILYNSKPSGNENQQWSLDKDGVFRSRIEPFELGVVKFENGTLKICAVRPINNVRTRFVFAKE